MDWKLFFTTFWMVFLAELGDKTQLTAMVMTSKTHKIWTVFLSASLALILVTLLGVFVANSLTNFISQNIIKKISGLLFISIGLLILLNKF
ncbi:TMEM165/GDT1 family protein [Desulfothermus okinawensis JCM 13304]